MSVALNHTIVHARDRRETAQFLVDILGLAPATQFGPFLVVSLANDVSLDVVEDQGPIHPQHYAFLVTEEDFDLIFDRIKARRLVPGPIRSTSSPTASIPTTVVVACTGMPRTVITLRSSRGPMAVEATAARLLPERIWQSVSAEESPDVR